MPHAQPPAFPIIPSYPIPPPSQPRKAAPRQALHWSAWPKPEPESESWICLGGTLQSALLQVHAAPHAHHLFCQCTSYLLATRRLGKWREEGPQPAASRVGSIATGADMRLPNHSCHFLSAPSSQGIPYQASLFMPPSVHAWAVAIGPPARR